MTSHRQTADRRWTRIVPDLMALVYSVILAWFLHWSVKDLVWGLWLSSLLVGFITIVLVVLGPVVKEVRNETGVGPRMASVVGGLFALAFFTVHFGMFHFVHSVFLNLFFPVDNRPEPGFPRPALYLTVLTAYWPFVIATAVSERQHLLKAIKQPVPTGPYKNVVRMHLLIFFFAGAALVHLDNFLVYCVVLFTYFFPFRAVFGRRDQEQQSPDTGDSISPSRDLEQRSR